MLSLTFCTYPIMVTDRVTSTHPWSTLDSTAVMSLSSSFLQLAGLVEESRSSATPCNAHVFHGEGWGMTR